MGGAQVALELALVLLLAATLFHALRLERALGVLKRDRAVLEELVAGFNESTRQAEAGVQRLRAATEGAGKQMARQIDQAQRLRDDLGFLTERGDKLAERLEGGVRSARMMADHVAPQYAAPIQAVPQIAVPQIAVPQMAAPQMAPPQMAAPVPAPSFSAPPSFAPSPSAAPTPAAAKPASAPSFMPEPEMAGGPRLRSEAERDLLRALRAAR